MVDRQDALGFPSAKPLDEADVQGLAVALRGELIRPEDDRYEGGKIVESWTNWDALGLLQEIGAIPSLG